MLSHDFTSPQKVRGRQLEADMVMVAGNGKERTPQKKLESKEQSVGRQGLSETWDGPQRVKKYNDGPEESSINSFYKSEKYIQNEEGELAYTK